MIINKDPNINVTISSNCIYDAIREGILAVKISDMQRMKSKRTKRLGCKRKPVSEAKKERSIELRDPIVDKKIRFGDFEGDTIRGSKNKGSQHLLVFVERLTNFIILLRLEDGKASTVEKKLAIIKNESNGS